MNLSAKSWNSSKLNITLIKCQFKSIQVKLLCPISFECTVGENKYSRCFNKHYIVIFKMLESDIGQSIYGNNAE